MAVLYFVFHIDKCSLWVPLQPRWVVSMGSSLGYISYLRIFILYLINILMPFISIQYDFVQIVELSRLQSAPGAITQKQPRFGARESYFCYQTLLQIIWQKQLFLSPENLHLIACCFDSINNCLIISITCCIHHSDNQ